MIDTRKRLFISYAHQDRNQVRYIVELLRAGGCEPWFDNQLVAGQDWKHKIQEQIRHCEVFVYVLTPKSVISDWCQWEFYEAIRLRKPVVPIMLRKAILTDALKRIHHVDFTDSKRGRDVAIAQLINAIYQAVPMLSPDEVPSAWPAPEGLPEQVRGTSAFYNNAQSTMAQVPLDTEFEERVATDELLPVPENRAAQTADRKRPAIFWWALVGLVLVVALIFIRSGALLNNPLVPPITQQLTQMPTAVVMLPTPVISDTSLPDTPTTQIIDTQQPSSTPAEAPVVPSQTSVPITAEENDPAISNPVPVVAKVSGASVNVRSGPGSNYRVIDTAQQGNQFVVIAQSHEGWLLVELPSGGFGWIWSKLVALSDEGVLIPYAATVPPAPVVVSTSTSVKSCNPGQWFPVCGSNGCGSEDVSQCNDQGTGYTCQWNPQQCSSAPGPGTIFNPPHIPTTVPGNPTDIPFVCTESWLMGQLQAYANEHGISLQELIQQLLPTYDLNHNGQIDCDDYGQFNGL